jgi:ATP-dependent DNA helicase RecQ
VNKPDLAIKRYFGFEQFRPNQREVIGDAMARPHTLAALPTGLGKSLCYQLPAQLMSGLTLVISLLIALMQGQVEAMAWRRIKNVTFPSMDAPSTAICMDREEIETGCELKGLALRLTSGWRQLQVKNSNNITSYVC